jgi:ribosomal-protein-alanine N-acetyltransferase
MNKVRIIPMAESHIKAVCTLSQSSFSVPWSEQSMRDELENQNALSLVAEMDEEVVGFLNAHFLLDEADLNLIAVKAECRKQGIGSMLFSQLILKLKEKQIRTIMLEVRESNATAISFYRSFGFSEVGRRKNYYQKPQEDALLLQKQLEDR